MVTSLQQDCDLSSLDAHMRESFNSFSSPWKTITSNYTQYNKVTEGATLYDLPEDKYEVEVAEFENKMIKEKGLVEDGLHFEHMGHAPDTDANNKQV